MDIVALVAAIALAAIAVFQLALAFGAPWGSAAWGGTNPGVLPARLRIASGLVGVLVYPLLIIVVLEAGVRLVVSWIPDDTVLLWVLAAFFLLGTAMNLVSRSKPERVWGPVSLVIAVCFAILAAQP